MTDKIDIGIDPNAGPDPTQPEPAIPPPQKYNTPGFALNALPWWVVLFVVALLAGIVYALVRH